MLYYTCPKGTRKEGFRMIMVYFFTKAHPECRGCKRFRSADDAMYWAETIPTCSPTSLKGERVARPGEKFLKNF